MGAQDAGATGELDKTDNKFYVAVDLDTWHALYKFRSSGGDGGVVGGSAFDPQYRTDGLIMGFQSSDAAKQNDFIRVDQGLDTNQVAPAIGLDSDLTETAFIIESDYRLGRIKPVMTDVPTAVNFIDDDNIASYYLTSNTYVNPSNSIAPSATNVISGKQDSLATEGNPQVFDGPRGATLHFRVHASQELQQSTYLFTQIGSSEAANSSTNIAGFPTSGDTFINDKTIYYIDTTIRVVGANTGYRLDIPVRYIKIK